MSSSIASSRRPSRAAAWGIVCLDRYARTPVMPILPAGSEPLKDLRNHNDALDHLVPYPQFQILQKLAHLLAINQFDLGGAVSSRLSLCLQSETASGYDQAFVG